MGNIVFKSQFHRNRIEIVVRVQRKDKWGDIGQSIQTFIYKIFNILMVSIIPQ